MEEPESRPAETTQETKKKRKGFFAIDRRTFARVCGLGMNPAVVYLILAQGTGGDQRTTSWSIKSVVERTDIGRKGATKALKTLIEEKIIEQKKGGSHPRYDLLPYNRGMGRGWLEREDYLTLRGIETGYYTWNPDEDGDLPELQDLLMIDLEDDDEMPDLTPESEQLLLEGGFLEDRERVMPDEPDKDYIWLPNQLVTGTSKGEKSPIRKLWETGDVMALRLFIDLYSEHDLTEDDGVDSNSLRYSFSGEKITAFGGWTVWGFNPENVSASSSKLIGPHEDIINDNADPFFHRLQILTDKIKLVKWIPYLRNATADGRAYFSLEMEKGDTPEEMKVATLARNLAETLIEAAISVQKESDAVEGIRERANYYRYLVPAQDHMVNVKVESVARLLYRPHTKKTSEWYGRMKRKCGEMIRVFEQELEKLETRTAAASGVLQMKAAG